MLFVGRLAVQKNLHCCSMPLQGYLSDLRPPWSAMANLKRSSRDSPQTLQLRNVRFHGRADGAELRDLYRNTDIFVLPSEREGMPLVLLEALAMGLPVVATDIPGSRDVIIDGINGVLVPPSDVAALRKALLTLPSISMVTGA